VPLTRRPVRRQGIPAFRTAHLCRSVPGRGCRGSGRGVRGRVDSRADAGIYYAQDSYRRGNHVLVRIDNPVSLDSFLYHGFYRLQVSNHDRGHGPAFATIHQFFYWDEVVPVEFRRRRRQGCGAR